MKKFICFIVVCLFLGTSTAVAQEINGISIEGDGTSFVVLLNGEQITSPTQSCFIALPPRGNLLIEAFSVENGRHARVLLREKLRYRGGLVRLRIDHGGIAIPPHPGMALPIYTREQFSRFLKSLKECSFERERIEQIKSVCGIVSFTSEQVAIITDVFPFESEKLKMLELIIPSIIDLQNSYLIADKFSFSSSKEKFQKMVQNYLKRR